MSIKNKNTSPTADKLATIGRQAGMVLMTAAVTFGMLESPDHLRNRVIVPNQPSFAFAPANVNDEQNSNAIRREREETAPHYISYSEVQRTPSRSGKH